MQRLLPLVLIRLASAFPPNWNKTATCPHDALYTSLLGDGGEFCSSVLEGSHCGRGYSTPAQYVTYNQTQISSYCECILTNSSVFTRTTGGVTATAGDTTSQTAWWTASETFGSVGRPGPGWPSGSGDLTRTEGVESTTAGSWNETRSRSSVGESRTRWENSTGSTRETFNGRVTSTRGSWNSTGFTAPTSLQGTLSFSRIQNRTSDLWTATAPKSPWNRTQSSASTDDVSPGTTSDVGEPGLTLSESSRAGWNTSSGSPPWSVPGNWTTGVSGTGGVSLPTAEPTSSAVGWNSSVALPTIDWPSPGTGLPSLTGSGSVPSRTQSGNVVPSGETAGSPSEVTGSVTAPTDGASSIFFNSTIPSGEATRLPSEDIGSITAPTDPSPTADTSSTFSNSTISRGSNATETSTPESPAANFIQVTRAAAVSRETCHTLARDPEGDSTRRALLYNSRLREENVSVPVPYVESVEFESGGLDPLYLTVRDERGATFFVDVSRRGVISIVDPAGNSMTLDAEGIHFSARNCTYSVSVRIRDLYEQLASLAGVQCAAVRRERSMQDMEFTQVLYLRDQCGSPVDRSLRRYPQLLLGDTACGILDVEEDTGRWQFDCTFPGSESGSLRCQWAIRNDIVDYITRDPFGGSCPDLSTVVTTLEASAQDILDPAALSRDLYNQGLNARQREEADAAVVAYTQLWTALREFFSTSERPSSAIEEYISVYNSHRSFENDICQALHAQKIPLNLTLLAGATVIPALTSLNFAPETTAPYNITIQDPNSVACCPGGSVAETEGDTCAYPREAIVEGTGCVCGRTADGRGIAFEWTECGNYGGGCETDGDCEGDGFVCLVGSCCGGGVCVDGFACSGDGVELVRFGV